MPAYHKFALIFGCNYPGTSMELSGCVNDANNVKKFLVNKRGFKAANVTTLYDRAMTRARMLAALKTAAAKTAAIAATGKIPALFLMYSGHGSRLPPNKNRRDLAKVYGVNDIDGDEALVPYDVETAGFLLDDTLSAQFIKKIHPKTQLFILTDCCNSGSNFDLPYQGTDLAAATDPKTARIIQLAACRDPELAMEINGNGVTTTRFLKVIGPAVAKLVDFRKAMSDLSTSGNPQHPQVSVSKKMMITGTLFPWLVRNTAVDAPRLIIESEAEKAKAELAKSIKETEAKLAVENLAEIQRVEAASKVQKHRRVTKVTAAKVTAAKQIFAARFLAKKVKAK